MTAKRRSHLQFSASVVNRASKLGVTLAVRNKDQTAG